MRAFVIGGSGAIGRAICARLLRSGWRVELVGRSPDRVPAGLLAAGARFHAAERHDAGALGRAFAGGAELLVDCLCYTAADAGLLLELAGDAGSTVMISSKAVYADAAGRHANSDAPPRFDGPIRESQSTLPPGNMDFRSREGYGPNKVAAEQALLESGLPVTILRPSKVHGPGARPAREWVYVKRALDGRRVVLLADGGRGVDHPSAAANIAALIETVAAAPGRRVLNAADPSAPSAAEIARIVARHLDHDWDELLLEPRHGDDPRLGDHPWNRNPPIVLDTSAAGALGYVPAGDYEWTVPEEIDWLTSIAGRDSAGRAILPVDRDHPSFAAAFDYDGEDAYLRRR